jgi:Domain of unknown function (DUF4115)
MPTTYGERLVAGIGLALVLILVVVALTRGGGDDNSAVAPPAPAVATPPPTPLTTTAETTPQPPVTTPTTGTAVLVVRATRGPSVVSIRIESEEGASLHEGVVALGETIRVSGDTLWIRLGAASNVDLTLNDRPVEQLPAGPIDLIATADSIQAES